MKKQYISPVTKGVSVSTTTKILVGSVLSDTTNPQVTPTSSSDYDGEFFARESVFDW